MTAQEQIRSVASVVGRTYRKALCTLVALHWLAFSVHAQNGESVQPPAAGSDLRYRPAKVYAATTQGIAVASYINPRQSPAMWLQLIASDPTKMNFVVANVLNGPGSQTDPSWTDVIQQVHDKGIKVLGYVDSGYMGLPGQLTRLGTKSAADWIVQAEQDVDAWYRLYGDAIDGIFFDDGFNDCTGTNAKVPQWYVELDEYVKIRHPEPDGYALTVLNPGTIIPSCYANTADILLTFEGSYDSYIGNNIENPILNYRPLDWAADPSKIWHIIYKVPVLNIPQVAELSRTYGAGYIEITNDILPNPYDDLPDTAYWLAEQAAVTGATPVIAPAPDRNPSGPPPSTPRNFGLSPRGVDYTSVGLQWASVNRNLARYQISIDDQLVATLPAGMTSVTIGNLKPGGLEQHTVSITAESQSGQASAPAVLPNTIRTMALPDNGQTTINGMQITGNSDSVVYKATFLMPYAFHRVFVKSNDLDAKCWIVRDNFCAHWVIENGNLLSFASDDGNVWKWDMVRALTPVVQGYNWTWTVSASDIAGASDGAAFQGEGYSPLTTLFVE
jgi:hypothetical protein